MKPLILNKPVIIITGLSKISGFINTSFGFLKSIHGDTNTLGPIERVSDSKGIILE